MTAEGRHSTGTRFKRVLRLVFVFGSVLLMGNLSALTDLFLHPEIPYFDEEHLFIGGVTASLTALLFAVLAAYAANLRRREEKLQAVAREWQHTFDAISDGVSIHDPDMIILKANEALGTFLNVPVSELIGKKCFSAFHNTDGPVENCPLRKSLASSAPEDFEFYEPYVDRWVSVSCWPIIGKAGEITGVVHIARDITKRKAAEEQIRRLNEDLEMKVQERTRQLVEAQEELLRKEKLSVLGQLAGSVGHELRNPLGVINNAVFFLKTVMPDSGETVKEYLNIIKNEVDNSQRIISALLGFTATRTPQAGSVTACGMVEQSLKQCAIPENIQLRIDMAETLPSVHVDPVQLGEVFQNLITNAVQAMPKGGDLCIAARLSPLVGAGLVPVHDRGGQADREQTGRTQDSPLQETGDFIEISVTDTGEGISPENMKKLFQPLFTTKARGIGFGLVMSNKLTEANGGRIEVESKVGEGTTFTVVLPAEVIKNA